MIGMVFPLDEEFAPFKDSLYHLRTVYKGPFPFLEGKYQGEVVSALVSGMGKVSAAMSVQALIDYYQPGKIILAGVAGGLLPKMQPGDIFLASEVCQHDVYRPGEGTDWQSYNHRGQGVYVIDEELLAAAGCISWDRSRVFKGRLLTGDKAVATTAYAEKLRRELNGQAVDMESAAAAQVAAFNKVPLVVIRAISDSADENAVNQFKINFSTACRSLDEYLKLFLDKLLRG